MLKANLKYFSVSWISGTSSNDHRQSVAARDQSKTIQLQKNIGAKDGLTDEVKPLHTNDGNPEKATASERPKGKLNIAYGSLIEFLQWCIINFCFDSAFSGSTLMHSNVIGQPQVTCL